VHLVFTARWYAGTGSVAVLWSGAGQRQWRRTRLVGRRGVHTGCDLHRASLPTTRAPCRPGRCRRCRSCARFGASGRIMVVEFPDRSTHQDRHVLLDRRASEAGQLRIDLPAQALRRHRRELLLQVGHDAVVDLVGGTWLHGGMLSANGPDSQGAGPVTGPFCADRLAAFVWCSSCVGVARHHLLPMRTCQRCWHGRCRLSRARRRSPTPVRVHIG
jgi:hypothetical protein